MVRQNDTAIQPLVIATIAERWEQRIGPTSTGRMVLKNIGRGTALHIQVNDIEVAEVPGGRFVAKFETIDYLEPGKDTVIDVRWHGEFDGEGASRRQEDFTANLNPRFAEETYDVSILYEDISGKQHKSVVRMGKGGIRLLKPQGGF